MCVILKTNRMIDQSSSNRRNRRERVFICSFVNVPSTVRILTSEVGLSADTHLARAMVPFKESPLQPWQRKSHSKFTAAELVHPVFHFFESDLLLHIRLGFIRRNPIVRGKFIFPRSSFGCCLHVMLSLYNTKKIKLSHKTSLSSVVDGVVLSASYTAGILQVATPPLPPKCIFNFFDPYVFACLLREHPVFRSYVVPWQNRTARVMSSMVQSAKCPPNLRTISVIAVSVEWPQPNK